MSTVTAERVPDPLEWHPAYAHMTDLLDWLNGTGPYKDSYLRVPVYNGSPLLPTSDDPSPIGPAYNLRTLTKKKCGGGAPYVGRPSKYLWTVAVDDLGRAIASDSERWYNPQDEYTQPWPDPYAVPEAWWLE